MQLYNTYRLYVKKYNLSVQFLLTSAEGTYRPTSGKSTSRRRNWKPCGRKRNARTSCTRRISGARPTGHRNGMRIKSRQRKRLKSRRRKPLSVPRIWKTVCLSRPEACRRRNPKKHQCQPEPLCRRLAYHRKDKEACT